MMSEEHKRKIVIANSKPNQKLICNKHGLGHKHTEEWKKKQSERSTGNTYALGRKQTEEEKQKRSFLFKGKRLREKNPNWRGGKSKNKKGYILILQGENYVLEHRIVMEDYLGRRLTQNEEVHHINGIKDDNRIENLALTIKKMHFGEIDCPNCYYKFFVK